MFNFDYITKEDTKEQNPNWPGIPEYQYRISIVGCSRSEKTNALLNVNHEPDNDEMYLYSKDPYEQNISCYLTKKKYRFKEFQWFRNFYWILNDMDDNNEDIKEYNPNRKQKILIVFDNMISDMLSNKKF